MWHIWWYVLSIFGIIMWQLIPLPSSVWHVLKTLHIWYIVYVWIYLVKVTSLTRFCLASSVYIIYIILSILYICYSCVMGHSLTLRFGIICIHYISYIFGYSCACVCVRSHFPYLLLLVDAQLLLQGDLGFLLWDRKQEVSRSIESLFVSRWSRVNKRAQDSCQTLSREISSHLQL